jgi:hypothetical protein
MHSDLARSGLFRDQVFSATEFARKHKEVLDQAAKAGAVTISRNNEQFALMPRHEAANLFRTVAEIESASEVLWGAVTLALGEPVPRSLQWLQSFDSDDLRTLAREVATAVRDAAKGDAEWESVEVVIHEWRESALVVESRVLVVAQSEPEERVELPDPALIGVDENRTKR